MPRPVALLTLLAVTVLAAPVLAASAPAADGGRVVDDYRLGPQDKLEIRVHDVRTGTGEAHQWAAFNGEFLVDAVGNVSLPLLGEMPAGGGTTADLARSVATRVREKVGLAQLPQASVQVIKYRPFYIMGAVERPGEYDYRPGLTVLQAASIAGGMVRPRDGSLLGFERDALAQRGDLRVLAAERQALAIRQARLDAEIAEASSVTFPPDAGANATGLDVARAVREERLLFEARRADLKAQLEALGSARSLLNQELASLDAKDEALARQAEILQKELAQVSGLVTKGLAVAPRQLAVEQSVAAYESSRIDAQVARLRARQDLTRTERDILDLRARRRNEALTEAAEVRGKLATITERAATAARLVYQAETRSPLAVMDMAAEHQPAYLLTHRGEAGARTRTVEEDGAVEPGDVLRVLLPTRPPYEGATGRSDTGLPPGHTADASAPAPLRR